jgi:recombination protein RecA
MAKKKEVKEKVDVIEKKKKEKKVEVAIDINGLDLAIKAIEKKYGSVISSLADHGDMRIPTVSTGSLGLDLALGCGGMGLGRIYEIFGPAGGGKSTLAVNVVIQAQKRGMNCLYVDAEHAIDPALLRSYGVNTKELKIVQGYDGEGNLDILERLVKTGAFKVAIVDSVSALIPRAEADVDISTEQMGKHAKLMSKALRRITPIANQTGTLIIFINQLRMKLTGFGNPEITTGGEAIPFYSSGRISVRGPESKGRRIVDEVSGDVIGHNTIFEIVKNKLAAPFKKSEIRLIYGQGYDTHREVLDMATDLGVVDKSGSWYKFAGESIGQGEQKVVEFFKSEENKSIYKEICDKVIESTGLGEIYVRHGQKGPLYT